jgi:hypothetical protein
MSRPFDYAPDRPEHIDQILNGLDRYNPETTAVFQDYVMQQCESQTYDCYANLALLKLCVCRPFHPPHQSGLQCLLLYDEQYHNVSYYPRDRSLNPSAR